MRESDCERDRITNRPELLPSNQWIMGRNFAFVLYPIRVDFDLYHMHTSRLPLHSLSRSVSLSALNCSFCYVCAINFIIIILFYCSLGVLLFHIAQDFALCLTASLVWMDETQRRSHCSCFHSISAIETDVNNNHKYYRYSIEKMSSIRYECVRPSVHSFVRVHIFWINKFIVIFPFNYLCLLLFKLCFSHIHGHTTQHIREHLLSRTHKHMPFSYADYFCWNPPCKVATYRLIVQSAFIIPIYCCCCRCVYERACVCVCVAPFLSSN